MGEGQGRGEGWIGVRVRVRLRVRLRLRLRLRLRSRRAEEPPGHRAGRCGGWRAAVTDEWRDGAARDLVMY